MSIATMPRRAAAIETRVVRPEIIKAAGPKGSRIKRFIITSDALDRDRDIVIPDGLDLKEYLDNPVFLWCHNFTIPPIGKCIAIERVAGGRKIQADFEFFDDGPEGLATRVYRLYDGGFLNMVSVGFKIIKAGPADSTVFTLRPEAAREAARVVYAATLLEVSAVPIGSNPDALQVAVQKGLVTSQFVNEVTSQDLADRVAKRLINSGALDAMVREKIAPFLLRAELLRNRRGT
jgi:hypothetical protein